MELMTAVKPTATENIQISLFLSLLTIATNLFLRVDVIGDSPLTFGPVFVFIGLLLLPPSFVFPIVVCNLLALLFHESIMPLILVILLEFLVIGYLKYKNVVLLLSSLLYWTFIGVPAVWIVYHYALVDLSGASEVLTLQTALNGLLNAAIASTILACLPQSWIHGNVPRQHRLSTNIFTICASILVLPLVIASFLFIKHSVSMKETTAQESLNNRAEIISLYTSNFLLQHKTVVEQLAKTLSDTEYLDQYNDLMVKTQEDHPAFFNLTTTDITGAFLFFAPYKYNAQVARLPIEQRTVRNRAYFRDAKTTQSTVISKGIQSRGVVRSPMISIASPITTQGSFNGVVFGAVNLANVGELTAKISTVAEDKVVVVTDSNQRILYSNSTELSQRLEIFNYEIYKSQIISQIALLQLNDATFTYGVSQNDYDWQIYVLDKSATVSHLIRDQYVLVSVGLLLVLSLFLVFAYKLSNKVTAPLIRLLKDEESFSTEQLESSNTSKEISDMAKKLKRSTYLMRNFESRLKLQVEEKTEQLEQLNLQLAAQAREDGLTKLYNRSGFNELAINAIKTGYRLKQPFSIALLDLDNFKNINDTYGHTLGDKCLVAFADLMQSFCKRETDIIGRYGGEEFVIYMSGTDIHSQHNIINNIHQQTRFITLVDDSSNKTVHFTVSIGVCTVLSPVNLSLAELINIADDELYKCKRTGRDRLSINTLGE